MQDLNKLHKKPCKLLLDFLRNNIIQVRAQQSLVDFKFKRTSSYVSQQYF